MSSKGDRDERYDFKITKKDLPKAYSPIKAQHTIAMDYLDEAPEIRDVFYREIVHGMVDNMSIDQLQSIFKLKVYDPRDGWHKEVSPLGNPELYEKMLYVIIEG